MKAHCLIFLLLPLSLFSQKEQATSAEKPSTDACPTWKKKKSNSKADYFNYLRTAKPKTQDQSTGSASTSFYQPKYRKPVVKSQQNSEEYAAVSSHAPASRNAPKSEISEPSEEIISVPVPENKNVETAPEVIDSSPQETEVSVDEKKTEKKFKRSHSVRKIRLFKGKCNGFFKRNKAASCPSF